MSFLSHYMGEVEYEPKTEESITNLMIYKWTKLFTTVKIINWIKKSNISRCKDTKKLSDKL